MKKVLAVAVAMAFAFAVAGKANAEDTKAKVKETTKTTAAGEETKTVVKENSADVKVKETTKTTPTGEETKTVMKEKSTDVKVKEDVKATGSEVKGKEVVEHKKGDLLKETVQFSKYDQNSDYIYVTKDNKEYRLKNTLNDSDKKNMLSKKKGDTMTITSTYPLTEQDKAVVTGVK